MATATAVVTRRGNDQFRGLFSDTWAVTCTLDAGSLVDGAGKTDGNSSRSRLGRHGDWRIFGC